MILETADAAIAVVVRLLWTIDVLPGYFSALDSLFNLLVISKRLRLIRLALNILYKHLHYRLHLQRLRPPRISARHLLLARVQQTIERLRALSHQLPLAARLRDNNSTIEVVLAETERVRTL